MLDRSPCVFALAAMVMFARVAQAADANKYPNWKGQWIAIVTAGLEGTQFKFDPTKAIPLDEVESAKDIVKRFATGAMSLGSISTEEIGRASCRERV